MSVYRNTFIFNVHVELDEKICHISKQKSAYFFIYFDPTSW